MITAEQADKNAFQLMTAANVLGHAINLVDSMGREGLQAIEQEGENADRIVIEGTEVMRAMRSLALRLDRCVLIKMPDEGANGILPEA